MLIDGNAQFGSITSQAIGAVAAEEENYNESEMHAALLANGMKVPSIFEQWMKGDSKTWVHPEGKESRTDFVAVSESLEAAIGVAWVDDTVDLTCQSSEKTTGSRRSHWSAKHAQKQHTERW